jgi:hypothetical protein
MIYLSKINKMNQPSQPIKGNPGKFSYEDNKLRISNLDGISSVLFEDISSISYKSNSAFVTDKKLYLIGFVISILFTILGITIKSIPLVVFGFLVGIGFMIYSSFNKIKWDDVTVETRGGKLLSYSVDFGQGENQVEEIEKLKREITQK